VTHGFLYSGGLYTTLDDPLPGVHSAGEIVGQYRDSSNNVHGFVESGGTYFTLDDPLATGSTFAFGINAMGQIVGYYSNNTGTHGFLYNPNGDTYTTLDDPSATQGTFALGINDNGQIVGYYVNASGSHGFLYSGGTYTTFDDPLGTNGTFARGINDAGQIIGTYVDSGNNPHGFLLTITPNPPPPGGTTADMIMSNRVTGLTRSTTLAVTRSWPRISSVR
jgi:probable HAF family extracellular repeat protein